ncbi:MAG TPA: 5-oxoprolinase subunit PxpB [Candidatus Polarisedimenticolia bacterium]|nr:5-oxoprolinase subunit PxpB [Candidatus Polarisedimenticolia bacterium]
MEASDSSLLVCFTAGEAAAPTDEERRAVRRLLRQLDASPLAGILDLSPGDGSLLVRFDPERLDPDAVTAHVDALLETSDDRPEPPPRLITIPVRYGGEDGPDLEDVARRTGLEPRQVIARHAGALYEVRFLGFTPGFAYLGPLDPALVCPRLDRPRRSVPAGSVGIAADQTAVYPSSTPGGWRLLGRTDVVLFDPARDPMSLLAIGDRVRFEPLP